VEKKNLALALRPPDIQKGAIGEKDLSNYSYVFTCSQGVSLEISCKKVWNKTCKYYMSWQIAEKNGLHVNTNNDDRLLSNIARHRASHPCPLLSPYRTTSPESHF